MRPIALHGHERAITYVKYSPDGDVLFSAAKDNTPTMWRANTGERIGIFHGHTGAVYQLDVTSDTKYLFSASADSTSHIWEVNTGKALNCLNLGRPIRCVLVSNDDKRLCLISQCWMKQGPSVYIFDISNGVENLEGKDTVFTNVCPAPINVFSALWRSNDREIILACTDGNLRVLNTETGAITQTIKAHSAEITSLVQSADGALLATSSKDAKAKVFDATTLEELMTFTTDRALNSVALSPIREHLVAVGGVEARDVTTTHSEKMESLFFNIATREEIGCVKGSFGTMNAVAFNPDGKSFITGGEDGYVRLCFFDPEYFTMDEANEQNLRELEELSKKQWRVCSTTQVESSRCFGTSRGQQRREREMNGVIMNSHRSNV